MSSGIHKNIKKINYEMIFHRFLQNRSQHGHCLNAVSCAGVLADQRFAKNPSMEFVFRSSIFFYVFMNTQYISVMQIKIYISNSSCAAFIAFTISSWFTSTVTRISDVEIIRMFTSALYKALNIRAAIP